MDTQESVGSLEEQALKRKERLKNLKRKNPSEESASLNTPTETVPLPKWVNTIAIEIILGYEFVVVTLDVIFHL